MRFSWRSKWSNCLHSIGNSIIHLTLNNWIGCSIALTKMAFQSFRCSWQWLAKLSCRWITSSLEYLNCAAVNIKGKQIRFTTISTRANLFRFSNAIENQQKYKYEMSKWAEAAVNHASTFGHRLIMLRRFNSIRSSLIDVNKLSRLKCFKYL